MIMLVVKVSVEVTCACSVQRQLTTPSIWGIMSKYRTKVHARNNTPVYRIHEV
jgi:hypothetical protein